MTAPRVPATPYAAAELIHDREELRGVGASLAVEMASWASCSPSRPREDHGTGGIPRTLWEASA